MPEESSQESEKPMSNALYQDNRTAPIVKKERKATTVSARTLAPGTYRPRFFEDVPWRIKYRAQRSLFTIWGPPQLNPHNDPLALLARRREERYAGRTR
ncbi:MAG TPA: hypothetical protein VM093_08045 [Aeromicrobium sp.]|nr:hypothetical protein [Aeromicrobium sp.]